MEISENKGELIERSFLRRAIYSVTLFILFLTIIISVGEILVRIIYKGNYAKIEIRPPYDSTQSDDYLGWKMKPNYHFNGKIFDAKYNQYHISINFDENGFKEFGAIKTKKPKVFFIGDSYTASLEASNEKSFFNLIRDSLDIEVFAYGQPGFGTLQEYMILDQWINSIQPKIIIWQTCSNDFIDNYAQLELVCGYKVGLRRPYLDNNKKIYYATPILAWQKIRNKCHFLAWLDDRTKRLVEKIFNKKKTGEYYIANEKREFTPFMESITTTYNILELAKNRIPDSVLVIGFAADNFNPQINEMNRIFTDTGFQFSRNPSHAIDNKVQQGITVHSEDGYHWNHTGQEVVANELISVIEPHLTTNK